jgi:drug/metabolite transporter (DMT)-like permease
MESIFVEKQIKMAKTSSNIKGILFLLIGHLILSIQGIAAKGFSSDYPILEMVLFRSAVALPTCLVIFRMEGHRGLPKTKHLGLNALRGLFLFLSYTTYFMAIASLPLADTAAIRNSAPLMLTLLSVLFLGEKVDLKRWTALIIGFMGVLLVVQPGSTSFDLGSIFVLISTFLYTLMVLVTRKLQKTDSSAAMSYFSTWIYIIGVIVITPVTLLVGEDVGMHPSIAFLFRHWSMPAFGDWLIMSGLGIVWASGMYFIARAYSVAEVSAVAPFEYSPLVINILWDAVLWGILPTWIMLIGALITIGSGWYILNYGKKELDKQSAIEILLDEEYLTGDASGD